MSPPVSTAFTVQTIAGAGRGVIASEPISKSNLVLRSDPPAAYVIFYPYRKEVCAQCFHYDRGRSLPVRLNSAGKVFCSATCESTWLKDQGELGKESWERLQLFLQAKSRVITNASSLPLLAPKPGSDEVNSKWLDAELITKSTHRKSAANARKISPFQHIISKPWTQTVDPDILSFLLSGILLHDRNRIQFDSTVLPLAMDENPYRTTIDLEAHIHSFLQLKAILPQALLPSVTAEVCQTLVNAASHNSFGIRSGSADGDEYMGYALFPDASYFNHSCRPSISKLRIGNIWEFRAPREIDVGEECCITYLGGDEEELNVEQRRQRLKEYWGFECMCARCKQESAT